MPRIDWVAWTHQTQRLPDMAGAFGGATVTAYPRLRGHPLPPLVRYPVAFVKTLLLLLWRRPDPVVAMGPPIFCQLAAYAATRLTGARLFLDSHPGAFGLQHDPVGRHVQPLHNWLCRHASGVFVTTEDLALRVERAGGRPLLLHEPPPVAHKIVRNFDHDVVVPTVFARDEPIDAVLGAAALLPSVRFAMTGDTTKLSADLLAGVPKNVSFLGFLGHDEFLDALRAARVALVISDEPQSVPRTAYEATFLSIPLVISDHPNTRRYFPHAIHVGNDPDAFARGCELLLHESQAARQGRLDDGRRFAAATWCEQARLAGDALGLELQQPIA